jgi:pyrroline-5-carboxylate reductase
VNNNQDRTAAAPSEYIFGFLGTGNMGGALARAACRTLPPSRVLLANRSPEKAQVLAKQLGCRQSDNRSVAREADFLFLGVKPQMMASLLSDIAPVLRERTTRFILVTIAAGLTIDEIRRLAGGNDPVIRIMPNTPASIGEGMILYTTSENVTDPERQAFLSAMAGAGKFAPLPEHLIDAGSAISGCGPAFVDLFIEALADGGVALGLPRSLALELASQMTAGSAKLVLESGAHPGLLKDAVCSPGGTTIQGVRTLEKSGFRSAVMEAVIATYEQTLKLGK